MKYTSLIDNVTSREWGLDIKQAYLFSWIYTLPSWANSIFKDGKQYFFASKNKAIEEMPLLTDKSDTMYRYYKSLESFGLIEIIKVDSKDYIALTEKAKLWNTQPSGYSDKNPNELGKLSESSSDKNPTNKNTNYYNNTIYNEKENFSQKEFFSVENLSGKVLGKIDIPSYENQQEFELITEQLNIQTPKEKEKSSAKKEKETFEPFLADLSDYFRSVGMFTQTRLENAKELICVAKNNQTELFKESVKNYKTVLADTNFYFKYKWDLFTFLKQQKGKSSVNWLRFVSGGDIWDSYLLQKKMESLKKEESAPTVMGRAPIRK